MTHFIQQRRDDIQPGQPVQMREALSSRLMEVAEVIPFGEHRWAKELVELAAQTLDRDERENAAMIAILVNAGYKDLPPRVNVELIKRLLGTAWGLSPQELKYQE